MSNLLIFKRVRNTRTQFLLSGRRLVFYHSRRSVKLYKNYIKSLRAGIKVSIRHLKEKNKNKILDMLYDYKSIITKLFELRTFYAFLQRKSKYESRKRRFRIFAIFKLLRGRKFFYLWNRKKERIFSKLKLFYI